MLVVNGMDMRCCGVGGGEGEGVGQKERRFRVSLLSVYLLALQLTRL